MEAMYVTMKRRSGPILLFSEIPETFSLIEFKASWNGSFPALA